MTLLNEILQAVGHPGVGRLAVSTSSAGFLVVGLDRFRQRGMCHKAHVRLVDAHAKRNRRADDHAILAKKAGLCRAPCLRRQSCVIGNRRAPFACQPERSLFHLLARKTIDDACILWMLLLDEAPQALAGADRAHFCNRVANIWTIEACDELGGILQPQLRLDFRARALVCRCRERNTGYAWKALGEDRELAILGAEIVTPLRNTVSLVNRKQSQISLGKK